MFASCFALDARQQNTCEQTNSQSACCEVGSNCPFAVIVGGILVEILVTLVVTGVTCQARYGGKLLARVAIGNKTSVVVWHCLHFNKHDLLH